MGPKRSAAASVAKSRRDPDRRRRTKPLRDGEIGAVLESNRARALIRAGTLDPTDAAALRERIALLEGVQLELAICDRPCRNAQTKLQAATKMLEQLRLSLTHRDDSDVEAWLDSRVRPAVPAADASSDCEPDGD